MGKGLLEEAVTDTPPVDSLSIHLSRDSMAVKRPVFPYVFCRPHLTTVK
jgi:hypothetical protein